jgi:hypothetical protein
LNCKYSSARIAICTMNLEALFPRRAIGLSRQLRVFSTQNAEQIGNDFLKLPAGLKT